MAASQVVGKTAMNPLDRVLIEKTGNDHGFEYVLAGEQESVHLGSARHQVHVTITAQADNFCVSLLSDHTHLIEAELIRSFPGIKVGKHAVTVYGLPELAHFLRRLASLARSLPNQAEQDYSALVQVELTKLNTETTSKTEVERMVRQRVGQDVFRKAMLDYWGGACAVTGISQTEVLRASHAKPWAECANDAERLDVFNGFLLSANLDALFDRYLISFDLNGVMLVASIILPEERARLGINMPMRLRWLADEHMPYLKYHQEGFNAPPPL